VNDRSSFRMASALIFGGELLYIGAGQFHPGSVPPNQHPEVFAEYANSAYWGAVHMGQFLGMALLLSGIVLLAYSLGSRSGTLDWLGRLATTSAVVTIALTGVLLAVDGVALKAAANAWLAAPVADQGARLAATEAMRWLEWAAGSYQLTMLGITLILVGAQTVVTVRIPRPIGVVMALSGFAYIAQGILVGAEGFSSNLAIPALLALVLDWAWMIWLVIIAWQKPRRVGRLATAPGTVSS
jgi:hypothetical protein